MAEMNAPEFGEYVAGLCRRDGRTDVRRITGVNGLGADVPGRLPDGRTAVVKCVPENGDRPVAGHDLREFHDGARTQFGAEATVLVLLGPLSEHERRVAARRGLTLIDADRLEAWVRGTTLSALLEPADGRSRTHRRPAHDD
ncbi:restriction endonuclease [Streptomyces sp. HMX87]|uniref:restriction endonuclease n=1 Tax=Streptomyces sp. HMX87 TaxID=3390849 RepID=UPI003A839D3E